MKKIRKNKERIGVLLPGLALGLVLATACAKKEEVPGDPGVAVWKGTVEEVISEIGELAAITEVEIRSEISGQVTALLVDVGDVVHKGQILVKVRGGLEAEDFQTANIRSPIDGVVVDRKTGSSNSEIEVGDRIRDSLSGFSGGTVLMKVAQLDKLIFEVEINEMDIGRLSQGQACQVTVDAYPGKYYPGTVTRISPVAKAGRRGVRIFYTEIFLDKVDLALKPGMTARARFVVARNEGAIRLPLARYYAETCAGQLVSTAYVAAGEGEAERRVLAIGVSDGKYIAVVSGLKDGDKVVQRPEGRPASGECEGSEAGWKGKWDGKK